MEEYKLARKRGEEDRANTCFKAARDLLSTGKVSDDEITAAMYL